ncbi:MAG: Rne/Rng family ribonuclease [Candidatus Neomarinimicrobiota bacterium]|nr:Rne/Rng family ribonuclease [Candidatus Neomarinimicrobiota bacterium]|tara:strand:+ start:231 stop:1778 length:1548 start_codon:yes stop_codon:yes gene_type:complete
MDKEIYISESMGESRIAIIEDGTLVEVYVEKQDQQRMVGNIYKGKVENVLPGMQAAFVDIGYDINAFLPFSEIENPAYLMDIDESEDSSSNKTNRKSNKHANDNVNVDLKTGQSIFVQVIKEAFAGKGPRITTEVAIPGRLLVLVPNSKYVGISKKIWDKYERRRLKKLVSSLKDNDAGIIVRTVAEGKSEELIKNDLQNLENNWQKILKASNQKKDVELLYEDLETASSVIRDLFTPDISKIVIDSKKLYKKINSYLEDVSPNMASRLEHYKIKKPLFESMGIENEIDKLLRPKVWLKSGAYLIIEKTEAMVVVDVNSGRFVGKKNHEENSLKINLEACKEVARQLRLRDLSGLVVIDFIDMKNESNRKKIYYELRKELKKDRAKVAVSPISDFGLLEMTRQRIRLSLLDSMSDECPTCKGAGRIMSRETLITRIDHWLRRYKSKNRRLKLKLELHPENADFMRDNKKALRGLMWHNFTYISVEGNSKIKRDEFRFLDSKNNGKVIEHVSIEQK